MVSGPLMMQSKFNVVGAVGGANSGSFFPGLAQK